MKKIRIGNDIHLTWKIYREGNPEDWSDKDLSIRLLDSMGKDVPLSDIDFQDEGSVKFSFYGKDQRRLGAYTALLVENRGTYGMTTVDHVSAFSLVKHTADIGGMDPENLRTEIVEIEDDIIGDAAFFVVNGEVCIQFEEQEEQPEAEGEEQQPTED